MSLLTLFHLYIRLRAFPILLKSFMYEEIINTTERKMALGFTLVKCKPFYRTQIICLCSIMQAVKPLGAKIGGIRVLKHH